MYITRFFIVTALSIMLPSSKALANEVIFLADPRILAVPIQENNDPLVDLRDQTAIKFGPSPEIPNNTDYTKMRKTVYDKLIAAQKLLPAGLKFCLYEGHRSIALQEKLFQERYAITKEQHPDWNHAQLFTESTRMVSPVTNLDGSKNVPPHSTGAAIDIYLIDAQGKVLDMGITTDAHAQDKDGSISASNSEKISAEAKKNRKIMHEVLEKVGFVNYPTEYWHWSYGDRYWAYHKQQPYALYGSR